MSDIEDETQDESTSFLHRKQCSNRVFIGPWDIKAPPPPPLSTEPEQLQLIEDVNDRNSIASHSSVNLLINHRSSITAIRSRKGSDVASSTKSPDMKSPQSAYGHTSSDGTSYVTAQSEANSSTYHSSNTSLPSFMDRMANQQKEDEDEEIDYSLLVTSGSKLINTDTVAASSSAQPRKGPNSTGSSSDTESIKTVRPTQNKGKLPMNQSSDTSLSPPATAAPSSPTTTRKKAKTRRAVHTNNKKKPLLWRKPGSAIASRIPTIITPKPKLVPTGKPIKIEPILCMRSVKEYTGLEPSRYKASKVARYDLLTEKWKQVELVLTSSYISTYSSSTYFWPKKRLEYRIYLEGSRRPKSLELFLLSSLDYTFGLRYQSHSTSRPTMVTHTFKARSFLKCQEWYMQLYSMLPAECKRPTPKWCEVYIPVLDLSVNLPLSHINQSSEVTMDVVKDAVFSILEEDGWDISQHIIVTNDDGTESMASADRFGLCWTIGDRAEWIYWPRSSSDKEQRIDGVICPQSLEKTHRLELRMIQHTPHDIVLRENLTLKEPPPVEGFLFQVSDFFGSPGVFNSKRKMGYFASFDQYLFYVPASKVEPPNMACFIGEDLLPKKLRVQSYVSALSPYTNTCTPEIQVKEVQRRMRLMIEAKGIIDLTEVSFVRRAFNQDINQGQDISNNSKVSLLRRSSHSSITHKQQQQTTQKRQNTFLTHSSRDKPCLEIIMTNGLHIRFEAYSSDTCDLWVSYLAQIIVYWKARKEAEKVVHSYDNFVNSACNISLKPEIDSLNKGSGIKAEQPTQKKLEQVADTRIWSYCLYEQCRDVVKSGILYYKPHKRDSYSQKIFILTATGWILFYDVHNRNSTKKSCNHGRKGAIDIAGCYFYSGVDCSKQKKGSNSDNLTKKAARIYSNGLSTDDDTLSRIFSIWRPKLRRYFSSQRQRLRVYHHDQRVNPNGTTWTFLAPSRREKEEWVCALNTVTEHMLRCDTNDRSQ